MDYKEKQDLNSGSPRCFPSGANLIFWNNQTIQWIDCLVNDILVLQMLQCGCSLDRESTKLLNWKLRPGFMKVTVLCKFHNLVTRKNNSATLEKWLETIIIIIEHLHCVRCLRHHLRLDDNRHCHYCPHGCSHRHRHHILTTAHFLGLVHEHLNRLCIFIIWIIHI
mgnify:FL=1